MAAEFLRDLFMKPMEITDFWRLAMLVPLAFSIAIVLKTIRCQRLRSVPLASLLLGLLLLGAMMLLGVALLLVFHIMA